MMTVLSTLVLANCVTLYGGFSTKIVILRELFFGLGESIIGGDGWTSGPGPVGSPTGWPGRPSPRDRRTFGPVASVVFVLSKPRLAAQGFDMGTVVYVVRGNKTDVFGIRKGQAVVAKTTGTHIIVSSRARNLNSRFVQCGAQIAPTCWGTTGEARWQAQQGLGLGQRAGASQRLYRRLCRLRSS